MNRTSRALCYSCWRPCLTSTEGNFFSTIFTFWNFTGTFCLFSTIFIWDFHMSKISQEHCSPRHQAAEHRPDERVPQLWDQALRSRGRPRKSLVFYHNQIFRFLENFGREKVLFFITINFRWVGWSRKGKKSRRSSAPPTMLVSASPTSSSSSSSSLSSSSSSSSSSTSYSRD